MVACVDLEAVRESLFRHARVVAKIARDYGFAVPTSAAELGHALIASFDQARGAEGHSGSLGASDVFRAAVRALGSNNRSWSSFLHREPELRANLLDYDPAATASALRSGALQIDDIMRCLPGVTGPADARATARWAQLLADAPDYHAALLQLRDGLSRTKARRSELPLLTAVILGSGSAGCEFSEFCPLVSLNSVPLRALTRFSPGGVGPPPR